MRACYLSRWAYYSCVLNSHPLLSTLPTVAPPSAAPDNDEVAKQIHTRKTLQALGQRVKELRLKKGWSRTTLATRAEISIATVRACETGRKVTQAEKIKAIALALGVSTKRLDADDTGDPRVKHWNDEDYEIGNWYHNAPRPLKNRLWALHEIAEAGAALLDPHFAAILESWAHLTAIQKNYVLNGFRFVQDNPAVDAALGGADASTTTQPKIRGPQR
jgi:transcriptional regulator with XRE-family HTH domain